jgi:hypothetical protein
MDFAITHHVVGEIAVVQLSGWIEIASAPQLRDSLINLVDDGHLHLVIDLSEVVHSAMPRAPAPAWPLCWSIPTSPRLPFGIAVFLLVASVWD